MVADRASATLFEIADAPATQDIDAGRHGFFKNLFALSSKT